MPRPDRAAFHFALIFAAHALGAMSLLAVLTAGPQLVAALGLTALELGGLASLYSGALALASLPAGLVVDRLGTRRALTLSALTIAVGLGLSASAGGFAGLGLGVALCGAGYGLINPAAGRAITLWFTPRWRTTLLGLKQTGVPLGAGLGSLTALLGQSLGWQAGILTAAAIAALSALLFALLLPSERPLPRPRDSTAERAIPALIRLPGLARANLAAGVTNGAQFALWAHLPELLQRAGSSGAAVLGLSLAALHIGTFLGRVVWGALTDRWLRGDAARGLRWLAATALMGTATLAGFAATASPALAVLSSFLLGFTLCAAVGLHVAVTARLAPAHLLGGAVGYTMLITNLGGVVVPILLGLAVAQAGAGGAALALAALTFTAWALLSRLP